MRINRKGFMLAEVVVVSVMVCVCLVTLATGIARVSKAYDTRNRYYDVNALYMAEKANLFLIKYGEINELLDSINSTPQELFKLEYKDNKINFKSGNENLANALNYYIFNNAGATLRLYISKYDKLKEATENRVYINSLKGLNDNQTYKEYIDYLSGHLDFTGGYNYLLIPEICDSENDCYYYGLGVK